MVAVILFLVSAKSLNDSVPVPAPDTLPSNTDAIKRIKSSLVYPSSTTRLDNANTVAAAILSAVGPDTPLVTIVEVKVDLFIIRSVACAV